MKARLSLRLAILLTFPRFALPERAPQSPLEPDTLSLVASCTNQEPIPFECCDEDESSIAAMVDYSAGDSLHLLQRSAAARRDRAGKPPPITVFGRLHSQVEYMSTAQIKVFGSSAASARAGYLGILPWLLVAFLIGMICFCPSILRPDPPIDKALMQKVSAAQQYAESPEVLWLNTLISVLWPKINVYVQNVMVNIV